MGKYDRYDGNILEAKKGLVIIPAYLGNGSDPILNSFAKDFFQEKKNEILGPHEIGDVAVYYFSEDVTYLLYYLSNDVKDSMTAVYSDIENELDSFSFKKITIGLLGISEFGFDEVKNIYSQEKWIKSLMEKHPDLSVDFVITDEDHRPQAGEHLGDGPIAPDEEPDYSDVPKDLSHHTVQMDLNALHSYRDYFEYYIEHRAMAGEYIRSNDNNFNGILNLRDLGYALNDYLNPSQKSPYPMAKWAGEQKNKTGGFYAPKPSKQFLKLIIILLDMSLDEAVHCFNFFGYGLAQYDREDKAFRYMLENWPTPIDPIKANRTLIKRFGKKASIINKE